MVPSANGLQGGVFMSGLALMDGLVHLNLAVLGLVMPDLRDFRLFFICLEHNGGFLWAITSDGYCDLSGW